MRLRVLITNQNNSKSWLYMRNIHQILPSNSIDCTYQWSLPWYNKLFGSIIRVIKWNKLFYPQASATELSEPPCLAWSRDRLTTAYPREEHLPDNTRTTRRESSASLLLSHSPSHARMHLPLGNFCRTLGSIVINKFRRTILCTQHMLIQAISNINIRPYWENVFPKILSIPMLWMSLVSALQWCYIFP